MKLDGFYKWLIRLINYIKLYISVFPEDTFFDLKHGFDLKIIIHYLFSYLI